jgi:hypothetical protein
MVQQKYPYGIDYKSHNNIKSAPNCSANHDLQDMTPQLYISTLVNFKRNMYNETKKHRINKNI